MTKCKDVIELEDGTFGVLCPECGKLKISTKRKNATRSRKRHCVSCSNRKPENSGHLGWYKQVVSVSFINGYIKSAKERHIKWDVDGDYLADLLISQDFKCALSGESISAYSARCNSASLDRIDSSKGYEVGNVQWLYRTINMMKQSYSQDEFIRMCKAVSTYCTKDVTDEKQY